MLTSVCNCDVSLGPLGQRYRHMEIFHAFTNSLEFTMKIQTLVAALILAAGGAAFAQTTVATPKDPLATPRIDQRQVNQEKRIEQGAASGQLSPREQRRLKMEEARIARAEVRAKSDGTVTAKERKHLNTMENHESKAIAHEKHDRQRDMDHDGKRDHASGMQHTSAKK
jgi:hypothetical protein